MHEQLQDFLNECIKKRNPNKWSFGPYKRVAINTDSLGRYYVAFYSELSYEWNGGTYEKQTFTCSIHDLFSIDSGLMEFVKWKDQLEPWIENKEFEFFDSNNKKCISVEYIQYTRHYLVMSTKTAEQKIQYFLDNALLP